MTEVDDITDRLKSLEALVGAELSKIGLNVAFAKTKQPSMSKMQADTYTVTMIFIASLTARMLDVTGKGLKEAVINSNKKNKPQEKPDVSNE